MTALPSPDRIETICGSLARMFGVVSNRRDRARRIGVIGKTVQGCRRHPNFSYAERLGDRPYSDQRPETQTEFPETVEVAPHGQFVVGGGELKSSGFRVRN